MKQNKDNVIQNIKNNLNTSGIVAPLYVNFISLDWHALYI
jgi:hypothetical protein